MTSLRLIADDLTGALDSAAQFTGALGPLPVLTGPQVMPPLGSFAMNLSCRDGSVGNARALSRSAVSFFSGADIAFKKIDSLLRGHWVQEIAEIVQTGHFRRIILAPAFPAQGRLTVDGIQIIARPDGQFERVEDLIAATASFRQGHQGATKVIVADAKCDLDLVDAVANFGRDVGTLWCGSAGLARALAGAPAVSVYPQGGSHLVLIGSHHAVTRDQVERYARIFPMSMVDVRQPRASDEGRCSQIDYRHGVRVLLPTVPAGSSPSDASHVIDNWLSTIANDLEAPSVLTVVGGETFASLCRYLGADTLSVEGESEPGIPVSRITAGRWHGTLCLSKSGAFGDPDWLLRHTAMAQKMAVS